MDNVKNRKWLVNLRKKNGMSQSEAAKRAGMTQSHMSKLETTRMIPSVLEAYALADIYHVTVDDIYRQVKAEVDHRPQKQKNQPRPRKWFTRLRKDCRMTKKELGRLSGLDQRTIANIEKGMKVNPKTAKKVAVVLDFDPARLYNDL